jgi:hypothetical protein
VSREEGTRGVGRVSASRSESSITGGDVLQAVFHHQVGRLVVLVAGTWEERRG